MSFQRATGLLDDPAAGRVRGETGTVDPAAGQLQAEEHLDPFAKHRVGHGRAGLDGEEPLAGRAGQAGRCGSQAHRRHRVLIGTDQAG